MKKKITTKKPMKKRKNTKIRLLREKTGLSQSAVAKKLKLSQQHVSWIEAGNRPSADTARRLAKMYGVATHKLQ